MDVAFKGGKWGGRRENKKSPLIKIKKWAFNLKKDNGVKIKKSAGLVK